MLDQQVTMTTATLVNLIRRRQAEPHTVLGETPAWYSEEARRAHDQRAHAELAAFGLADGNGIHPGLLATVDAIARPALEYYGWVNGGHEGRPINFTLLAGSAAGEAFVVARDVDKGVVVIVTVRPEELLDNFLAQIPQLPPGRGQQLSVPKSAVVGRRDADREEFELMRTNRPSKEGRDAAELKRILGLHRIGGGSLYVAARNRTGTRHRIDKPVTYIDTGEGRWLTEEVPGAGEPQYLCTPATPQLLQGRLRNAQSRLPVN
ncbi:ESAT-6 protein secretion system EspG family protein [Prauserella shujinwangii]|uniref:ESAT-6 protein secretion system EspG family protein n=1 Tax=Prauserella shujinwangii TaxID=1453103 RepID=A0A2T0LV45_9PSEU|nr:ESX secretion-associated protein EspG [Prauserella shujinwangii]PRX47677.1 ESAT-6 protein secretion system EspG family protein [Prauserella shujinwangii]